MLASASFSQAFCKQFSEFGHYTTISIPHNCDNLSSMLSTLPKVQRPHPELCRGFFQGCLESHVWKSSAHTSRSSSWTSFLWAEHELFAHRAKVFKGWLQKKPNSRLDSHSTCNKFWHGRNFCSGDIFSSAWITVMQRSKMKSLLAFP